MPSLSFSADVAGVSWDIGTSGKCEAFNVSSSGSSVTWSYADGYEAGDTHTCKVTATASKEGYNPGSAFCTLSAKAKGGSEPSALKLSPAPSCTMSFQAMGVGGAVIDTSDSCSWGVTGGTPPYSVSQCYGAGNFSGYSISVDCNITSMFVSCSAMGGANGSGTCEVHISDSSNPVQTVVASVGYVVGGG